MQLGLVTCMLLLYHCNNWFWYTVGTNSVYFRNLVTQLGNENEKKVGGNSIRENKRL